MAGRQGQIEIIPATAQLTLLTIAVLQQDDCGSVGACLQRVKMEAMTTDDDVSTAGASNWGFRYVNGMLASLDNIVPGCRGTHQVSLKSSNGFPDCESNSFEIKSCQEQLSSLMHFPADSKRQALLPGG